MSEIDTERERGKDRERPVSLTDPDFRGSDETREKKRQQEETRTI